MDPVCGLWVGGELTRMEQMTIRSFQAHGHPFHLYLYNPIEVPKGTVVEDAAKILHPGKIFRYKHNGSLSGFSNLFRYRLLQLQGGIWVDMDVTCLKPFAFPQPYVFCSEHFGKGRVVACSVIKVPPRSELMNICYRRSVLKDPEKLQGGETGPLFFNRIVKSLNLGQYQRPVEDFLPFRHSDWGKVFQPGFDVPESAYCIHWWGNMWRGAADKNAFYHRESLYERMAARYLV